ncbi:hypothetical protein V502_02079 [Pseudogymnoascus sp. VKM F-4520 (FW-2644)]|nr:hypothetical protein V502_02079 [Pseudogymnoascus sp. VKM F-4520 (FW-2644)]
MKPNVLSTLGVFTTLCQPVSSCVYGTSLVLCAEGGFEGSPFGYTDPIEPLNWSQMVPDADGSRLVNVGEMVDVLVHGTIGTATKINALRQFDVDISTEHRVIGEYFSVGSHFDFDTPAVAFLAPLDKTYSTQVFDTDLSPITHIVELGQIATATAKHLSFTSPMAHPNNNPVMRYSSSLTTPSCSEGVDGIIIVAPVVISDEATDAASEMAAKT